MKNLILSKPLTYYGDDLDSNTRYIGRLTSNNNRLSYKPLPCSKLTLIMGGLEMTRKRATVESSFAAPWIPTNPGDCLEGIYMGQDEVPAGKGRHFTSYKIRTEGEEGKLYGVSSAMLKTKMNQIPKGAFLWVTFKGMIETENGASRDYNVEVEHGTKMVDPFQGADSGDLNNL